MELQNVDKLRKWIKSISVDGNKYKAVMLDGKIVEAYKFDRLIRLVAQLVANDTTDMVAETLNIPAREIYNLSSHKREHADARKIVAHILRHRMGFNYQLSKHAIGYVSNRSLKFAYEQIGVREVQAKLQKVYSRFPFLNDEMADIQ